jgi:hypothetical protein
MLLKIICFTHNHWLYRVPGFPSKRPNWVPPHPQASAPTPLWVQGIRHIRLRGRVWGDPIPTEGKTLWGTLCTVFCNTSMLRMLGSTKGIYLQQKQYSCIYGGVYFNRSIIFILCVPEDVPSFHHNFYSVIITYRKKDFLFFLVYCMLFSTVKIQQESCLRLYCI